MKKSFWLLISGIWLLVSACGFEPQYGRGGSAAFSSELASVKVSVPGKTRAGQVLTASLEDIFSPSGTSGGDYILEVNIRENEPIPTITDRDRRISRYKSVIFSDYRLKDSMTGKILFSSKARAESSYNVVISDFATFVADENARELAAKDLAGQIASSVKAYFADN